MRRNEISKYRREKPKIERMWQYGKLQQFKQMRENGWKLCKKVMQQAFLFLKHLEIKVNNFFFGLQL